MNAKPLAIPCDNRAGGADEIPRVIRSGRACPAAPQHGGSAT